MNDLGWQRGSETKLPCIHGGKNVHELWENIAAIKHILRELGTKIMFSRVSYRTRIKLRVWLMGSTKTPQDFDRDEFPKFIISRT